MSNKRPNWWPKCIVAGCDNGKCYALDSEFCYPHTKARWILDKMLKSIKKKHGLKRFIGTCELSCMDKSEKEDWE